MKILGIDVGIDGALAFIEGEQRNPSVELHDLPTIGEKSKREIDVPQLAKIITAANPAHAFIENVWAMPSIERLVKPPESEDDEEGTPGIGHNQPPPKYERVGMGAASAWRFGLGIGQIRGCVATLGIPYTLVTPQKWMKIFGLRGNDKESHRQYAIRRIPNAAQFMTLKKNHQRADALLLAFYGLLYQSGETRGLTNDRARDIDDELDDGTAAPGSDDDIED